jgi:hypothetical protein
MNTKEINNFYIDLYKFITFVHDEASKIGERVTIINYNNSLSIHLGFNVMYLTLHTKRFPLDWMYSKDDNKNPQQQFFGAKFPKSFKKSIEKCVKKLYLPENVIFTYEKPFINFHKDLFPNRNSPTIQNPPNVHIKSIQNFLEDRKLVLNARYDPFSNFYKDNFPLDMFKIIYWLCFDINVIKINEY